MKISYTTVIWVAYFSLFASVVFQSHTLSAYGQIQNSSFAAEINALDRIPIGRIKVSGIEIAFKQLGNDLGKPILLINGLATTGIIRLVTKS